MKRTCSVSFITYEIAVGVIYIMLLSLIPTERTGVRRVRIDCLNFVFSLCMQIKKQISITGRRHWDYISCGILDPAAIQDCTKFRSKQMYSYN